MFQKGVGIIVAFLIPLFVPVLFAQDGRTAQAIVFPIAADLFSPDLHFETTYIIINLGQEPVPFKLDFFHSDGTLFLGVGGVTISPNGLFHQARPLDESVTQQNGWTRLELSSDAKVLALSELTFFLRFDRDYQLLSSTQVQAVKPARKFRTMVTDIPGYSFPLLGRKDPNINRRQSAYSIVNPSRTETAKVDFTTVDSGGRIVCSASLIIPPLNRVSKFATEIFTSCSGGPFLDRPLFITSDTPIGVGALDLFLPGGKFTNLAVIAIDSP